MTADHGMRDSGGHSGNSYAETHIPLLVIGSNCQSNNEKLYKQIDFASTFSIMNGLPIPSASIGSIIPEMLNVTKLQKLDTLKKANQRLIKMIEGDGTEEYKFHFEKAKSFHQMFANDSNNKNAFLQAEFNYLTSTNDISDRLSQRSLEVNIFQVILGLLLNILISMTILLPTNDDLMKDLTFTSKNILLFIIGGFCIKILVINEIFDQTNDTKSFLIMTLMTILLRIVLGIFNAKFERFKWFHLFEHDLLYLLMLGHFFFIISVGGSSFVEEEHQIWYYLCNTMFVFFTSYEFRGRTSAKTFITVTAKCISFLALHVVIRRMNQTGDKWINVPDLGDWLHREINQHYLHTFIVFSLIASAAWVAFVHCSTPTMLPFILIGNILLYFHHTRSINNR